MLRGGKKHMLSQTKIFSLIFASLFLANASLVKAAPLKLDSFARQYAFRISYIGKTALLTNRYHSIKFELNSRRAQYMGVNIWMNKPVTLDRGSWFLDDSDANKLLHPLLNPNRTLKKEGSLRIVLDPGHGGDDRGAAGRSKWATEKRLNLDIALRVQALLAKNYEVHLTRSTDVGMSLEERCEFARKLKADLYVSIHLNASAAKNASGIETHILTPRGARNTASSSASASDNILYTGNAHDGPNTILGYTLQKHLLRHVTADDRGLRKSRFFVLRNAPCPAALVECGFLSNRVEENKLLTAKHRELLAKGIAEGIHTYLASVKRARAVAR